MSVRTCKRFGRTFVAFGLIALAGIAGCGGKKSGVKAEGADAGAVTVSGSAVANTVSRPSKSDCEKVASKVVELMSGAVPEGTPPEVKEKMLSEGKKSLGDDFVNKCMTEATTKDTECILRANSMDDFVKCK